MKMSFFLLSTLFIGLRWSDATNDFEIGVIEVW